LACRRRHRRRFALGTFKEESCGRSVFDSGFTVGSGNSFEVVLKKGAATIEGNVLGADRKPVPGAVVAIGPVAERRQNLNLYWSVAADAAGHFELRGVAPGDYKIFAMDYLPDGALMNSRVIARYEDRASILTVKANDKLTGDLNLIQ
jgi:hypothetical protein